MRYISTTISCSKFIRFLWLIPILFLTACYPLTERKSAKTTRSTFANMTECKLKANTLIGRDLELDNSYSRSDGHALEIAFAKYDAHKQRGRYFKNCLSQKRKMVSEQ